MTSEERQLIRNRAADLIEQRGWCQNHEARTTTGRPVLWSHQSAAKFCVLGACSRAAGRNIYTGDMVRWTGPLLEYSWATWQDQPGRTRAEVVAFLRSSAERPPR